MGIPVAVQHLVKDNEVFKDASLQLGTWRGCCCAGMLLRCFHFQVFASCFSCWEKLQQAATWGPRVDAT